jgi:hypothetical protein
MSGCVRAFCALQAREGTHILQNKPGSWPNGIKYKLEYAVVSKLCMPLSMARIAASTLGPVCDGVGFGLLQSSCQKVTPGTNPSNL